VGRVFFFFSSVLQQLLLGQLLLQWGVATLQSTSYTALELTYLCACLLGACIFASTSFSGSRARSVIHQPAAAAACCDGSLFLHATEPSDCGCLGTESCSLPPSLPPYFRQWPITHLLLAFLPIVYDDSHEFSSLPLPPSPVYSQEPSPHPLCTSFQFHCLLFRFFCFLFFAGGSVCPGRLCWFWLRDTMWHLVLICLVCQKSPKHVWIPQLAVTAV
jgi:hypothetical protein